MADIEPPSFSLGLDLEPEPQTQTQTQTQPQPHYQPPKSPTPPEKDQEDEPEFHFRVPDSDPDDPDLPPLRRLRRGGPLFSKATSDDSHQLPTFNIVDDDIEEFSSQENVPKDDIPAPQQHSLCSSLKYPLSGCGVLTRQQESITLSKKRKQDPSCPPSSSLDSSRQKSIFSDLMASPLRRFQLLDSDSESDTPLEDEHVKRDARRIDLSKQNKQKEDTHGHRQIAREININRPPPISQRQPQDLWKEFHAAKTCVVPTPAFDEFCEDYFSAKKENKTAPSSTHELFSSTSGKGVNSTKIKMPNEDLSCADPSSHRYFFHDDLRIQRLVCSRLPHFSPLSGSRETGNMPYNASAIDYMSQFSHGDGAKKQIGSQVTVEKKFRKAGKKAKKSNVEDASHASGDWVNPKRTVNTPKDAGRRRVCADGKSAGYWKAENGMKVYVTKTGQQLTGQLAYRQYRKESGRGFKGIKKKPTSKRK